MRLCISKIRGGLCLQVFVPLHILWISEGSKKGLQKKHREWGYKLPQLVPKRSGFQDGSLGLDGIPGSSLLIMEHGLHTAKFCRKRLGSEGFVYVSGGISNPLTRCLYCKASSSCTQQRQGW